MTEFARVHRVPPTDELRKAVGKRLLDHRVEERDTYADRERHNAAVVALLKHMEEISDDPSGSDPRLYFDDGDVATLMGFADLMDGAGWPGSDVLGMRKNPSGKPVWKNRRNTAKHPLKNWLSYPKVESERRGYKFGQLGTAMNQQLAFGEDRLLYAERGPELEVSYGDGWGRLPDPGLLEPALSPGYPMIRAYGTGSLADSLMLTLPTSVIRDIRQSTGI